jgi:hypothetical protein
VYKLCIVSIMIVLYVNIIVIKLISYAIPSGSYVMSLIPYVIPSCSYVIDSIPYVMSLIPYVMSLIPYVMGRILVILDCMIPHEGLFVKGRAKFSHKDPKYFP